MRRRDTDDGRGPEAGDTAVMEPEDLTDPDERPRDDEVAEDEHVSEGGGRRADRLTLAAGVLALLGLAAAVLGGLTWWAAAHDGDIATAQTRDRALVAASNEIATLNTLDYRDVDGGLRSWLAVTTGGLHDQLAQAGAQDKQLLADQKKVTTARVVQAALTDLDAEQGTATAVAAVEITVRGTSGAPAVKRNRFSANLVRDAGRWKLESLTQVAVDAS